MYEAMIKVRIENQSLQKFTITLKNALYSQLFECNVISEVCINLWFVG